MRGKLIWSLLLGSLAWMQTQAATPEALAALERGRELFDHGRWSDARLEFLKAREGVTPADYHALQSIDYHLAACAVELGSRDAEAALLDFEQRYPGSVFANDVRFSLGSYYCTQSDFERARDCFERTDYKALDRSRREQYDVRMGYVAFTEGRYDQAYDYFDRIGSRSRYIDHARYYKAYIDYAEGRYGRARQGFEQLARSEAYGPVVPYYLLQIEFREGNYRYVVDHGDELMRKAVPARRAELARVVAESWFHLGDYNRTLEYLAVFEESGGEPGRDENYLKGFSLYRTARYAEAEEPLRKACGADDALTQNASYHLADCCLRNGDKQSAMEAFAMAANEQFDATIAEDALFNYGKLQYELGGGAFNGAINVLSRYVERYPSSPRAAEARTLLVAAYYNSRDYDAAYEAIRAVPEPDAEIRAALQKIAYFRALEAYSAGDLAAAQRSLDESERVNVSPKYAALGNFWQGEIAFAQGDRATAASRYNAYLKRAPRSEREYALAWYNLGYCDFDRGRMSQARASFEKFLALRTAPARYRADACNRLGDTYYSERSFDRALEAYARAEAAGGDASATRYARYQRAVTLGIVGRNDEKIAVLRQLAADRGGEYADAAAYELGRTYIAQQRYDEGARALERFVEEYPSSPRVTQALSDLGLAYLNLGDRARSLSSYERVVSTSPHSPEAKEAMQGIREIYVEQGNVDGYFAYAERVGAESDLTALSRDSLTFAAAQKLYLADRVEDAAKSLRSYVNNYPKGYYLNDALYYLSDCYLRSGEREYAIESLTELASRGQHPYRVTVLEKLSELTYAEKRYDEAAAAYRQLYDAAPTASGREDAMTGYVRATLAGGDTAKIEAMAADVAAHPDAGATALRESKYALAGLLRERGDGDAALKLYRELAAEVRTKEGCEAAYRLIEAQFASGDLEGCEKAVFAFADREPASSYWLAKAYILLGDLYVRRGDSFQARATYQSVADGYSPADDGIVDEAKKRIEKLN
ncbi:tetratricopeptide repeat protein [uncultured Alistipes sp.]|uniref:tetratricopeptide repeat protein n=1 Tax=uncultured Alistipes sp. TaxID=538949 RepID=UPI00266CCB8F|nr:tetratricopeptide repeat protein [uncultured Alistipes sp.]